MGWKGYHLFTLLFSVINNQFTLILNPSADFSSLNSIFACAMLIHYCENRNIEHAFQMERRRQQRTKLNNFKTGYFKSHMPAALIISISLSSTSSLGC